MPETCLLSQLHQVPWLFRHIVRVFLDGIWTWRPNPRGYPTSKYAV